MANTNGEAKVHTPLWETVFKAAERYGIAVVLAGVLLWWNRQDRDELTHRLDEQKASHDAQNEFIQTKLIVTVENNTKALERVYTKIPAPPPEPNL